MVEEKPQEVAPVAEPIHGASIETANKDEDVASHSASQSAQE